MKTTKKAYKLFIANIVLGMTLITSAEAQLCDDFINETTPTTRFTINDDGTVEDNRTGLMWTRCNLGQTGIDCSEGEADMLNWIEALEAAENLHFAGHKDWRLPNIKELNSIIEEKCHDPSINLEVFPGTIVTNDDPDALSSYYLSSTPAAPPLPEYQREILAINFVYGSNRPSLGQDDTAFIRVVRNTD